MSNALKFDVEQVTGIPDPTTESGEIFMFPEALGQNGRPFVFMVEDPPNQTRPRHHHHGDVLYVYVKGEHRIEGEGTYRAGDLRWTRAGHVYGPETTGPEGGAWWVISYSDPIPVNARGHQGDARGDSQANPRGDSQDDAGDHDTTGSPTVTNASAAEGSARLPTFSRPYDWNRIDDAVRIVGGAILERLLSPDEVDPLNHQIDAYLTTYAESATPASGSPVYDIFLGHQTLRLHGLVEKLPRSADLIGHPELVSWAERLIEPTASSVLLNAGELIQIQPGEPAQFLHRDTDSWPALPIGKDPVLVNAIVALDPITLDNGATYIAPESWRWEKNRRPASNELARAVMNRGDAVLFRGDLLHGGGENASDGRRRALSISYCAGWLRPVENSFLNVPRATVRELPEKLQAILGYSAHDASSHSGGMVGLFENGDPTRALSVGESRD